MINKNTYLIKNEYNILSNLSFMIQGLEVKTWL